MLNTLLELFQQAASNNFVNAFLMTLEPCTIADPFDLLVSFITFALFQRRKNLPVAFNGSLPWDRTYLLQELGVHLDEAPAKQRRVGRPGGIKTAFLFVDVNADRFGRAGVGDE